MLPVVTLPEISRGVVGFRLAGEVANCFLDDAPVSGFGFCIPITPQPALAALSWFFGGFALPMVNVGFGEVSGAIDRALFSNADSANRRGPGHGNEFCQWRAALSKRGVAACNHRLI